MESSIGAISVRDLLKSTYAFLFLRNNTQKLEFSEPVKLEIHYSQNPENERGVERLVYTDFGMFRFGSKNWVITRGESDEENQFRSIEGDLMAFEFSLEGRDESKILESIVKKIGKGSSLQKSIIFARTDGSLTLREYSPFYQGVISKISRIKKYVISDSGKTTYRPQFAEVLASSIEEVLKE
jgi:hypothetical protein